MPPSWPRNVADIQPERYASGFSTPNLAAYADASFQIFRERHQVYRPDTPYRAGPQCGATIRNDQTAGGKTFPDIALQVAMLRCRLLENLRHGAW